MKRGALAALAVFAIAVEIWLARRERRPAPPSAPSSDGSSDGREESAERGTHADPSRGAETPAFDDAGLPRIDRVYRDEMRKRIFEAIAREKAGAPAPSSSAARAHDMSDMNDDELHQYLDRVIRSDFFPLGKQCYQNALEKSPELEGSVSVSFNIVGDAKTGGVVEHAEILDGGAPNPLARDEEFLTCLHESLLSITFDAPPGNRKEVTVGIPMTFLTSPPPP